MLKRLLASALLALLVATPAAAFSFEVPVLNTFGLSLRFEVLDNPTFLGAAVSPTGDPNSPFCVGWHTVTNPLVKIGDQAIPNPLALVKPLVACPPRPKPQA